MRRRLRSMTSGRRGTSDDGSALILAIVFVTVIGLAAALALGYAATTMRATANAYAPNRDRLYTSDAAMKAAVKYVVGNPAEGKWVAAGTCSPIRTYGTVRGDSVTTQICPQTNSLTPKGGGSAWGLQTLATGSEKGLVVTGKGGVQINGNVNVNSQVDVGNNSRLDVVSGTIKALGGCNQNVYVDGVLQAGCTVASAPASDPNYAIGLTAAPAAGTGSCNTSTDIATLGAGTWTNSTFAAAIGSCDYVNLTGGYHYLEDVTWDITNKVVAGQLNGSIKTSKIGEACTQGTNGATLVLGGTTQITLKASTASLEICGMAVTVAAGKSVELPLYGPKSDIFTPTTGTLATSTNPTGSGWSSPANAKAVDTTVATISLAKSTTAGDIVSTGWNLVGGGSIPATVTSLNAVVTAVSSSSATFTLAVRNSGESTNACTGVSTAFPTGSNVSATTKANVTLTCTKALVAPLTVRLTATSGSGGSNRTIKVDGLTLGYAFNGPTIKAQSGCVTQISGCAVLSSTGNNNYVFLDGEVYLPKAKVDVQLPNDATALSTLGLVVRVLAMNTTGSTQVIPVVALENGQTNPGDVVITVDVGSVRWMTCRATFAVTGARVTDSRITSCTRPR